MTATTLDFALPAELEASETPEERGLRRDGVRLLVARRGSGAIEHRNFSDLAALLDPGDVLVVNTSATLPAAVSVHTGAGIPGELHFSTIRPDGRWVVELRHAGVPASTPWLDAEPGTTLALPGGGCARLLAPAAPTSSCPQTRLWVAGLDLPTGTAQPAAAGQPSRSLLCYLALHGRPIRYSYVSADRPIGAYQTVFADQPGSAEMPSAARPFSAEIVTRLVTKGVELAPFVLHTGVASLEDHEPPLAEWYRIPAETAARVNAARLRGHRVIAVGTTAVRALETVAGPAGLIRPDDGWTELIVTPERPVRAVDGLITGWHEPQASHLALLDAVAGRALLEASYGEALKEGYLWHEFGDSHLILP
jgi:S-adenosylmethionine:tRNA ribosyltransferase-isomerase